MTLRALFIFLILFFLVSCGRGKREIENFDIDLYQPSISHSFSVKGNENNSDVLITSLNPWQGAKDISSNLLISENEEMPEDFNGQILKKRPQRIICMSSTHIALLEALEATDKIVGVSGMDYITNPYIRRNEKNIPDIGYEGNIDYEKLVAVNPDLVLLFAVNNASSMEPKLKELKIPYFYVGDYLEESPLGKAEWIVAIAELLGERKKGEDIFNEIKNKYYALKNCVSEKNLPKPKVMVNAPFLDSWFMPSTESYVAKMISDAGGEYLYNKNNGNSSVPIDLEEALLLVSEADYWINIGNIKSKDELISTLPRFSNVNCVVNGKIFNNNRKSSTGGGNDCYESGIIHPDIVLRDLIKIFHPEMIQEDFIYYQKLE